LYYCSGDLGEASELSRGDHTGQNFTQLDGESIDAMFSRFQTIVNKMRANKAHIPYDDHERALKLLCALDRKVWDVKVTAIIESSGV
jgi:hypothetical protein